MNIFQSKYAFIFNVILTFIVNLSYGAGEKIHFGKGSPKITLQMIEDLEYSILNKNNSEQIGCEFSYFKACILNKEIITIDEEKSRHIYEEKSIHIYNEGINKLNNIKNSDEKRLQHNRLNFIYGCFLNDCLKKDQETYSEYIDDVYKGFMNLIKDTKSDIIKARSYLFAIKYEVQQCHTSDDEELNECLEELYNKTVSLKNSLENSALNGNAKAQKALSKLEYLTNEDE